VAILGDYAEFGICNAADSQGQRYWTQVFATAEGKKGS